MKISKNMTRVLFSSLVLACMLATASPAHAHKLKIFASFENGHIEGYAYFSGGGRPKSVEIKVQTTDGKTLGSTKTNDNGEFTFQPKEKVDHVFIVDPGDGHVAKWTTKASEFSATLDGANPTQTATQENSITSAQKEATTKGRKSITADSGTNKDIAKVVSIAVGNQISPLREELNALKETIRLHDILGGIGYIFGMFGIAFYFAGKKRLAEANASSTNDKPSK